MFDKLNKDLNDLFENNGWHNIKNSENWIMFTKIEVNVYIIRYWIQQKRKKLGIKI